MTVPATLDIHNAHKAYGRVQALRGVDCALAGGQLVALLGANGSGKTTLVRALAGLHRLDQGAITLCGHPAGSPAARCSLGVMLQDASPPDTLQVRELIALFGGYYPDPLPLAAVLDMTGLAALAQRRYGSLSGGERRRVQCALAVCGNPAILVLDEPTVHMDAASRDTFRAAMQHLHRCGTLILLVSHQMEEIEALAQRVLVIDHGTLVGDGTLDSVRRQFGLGRIACTSTLGADILDALEGVVSWHREGTRLRLLTRASDRVLSTLLQADPDLGDITVEAAPLDEAIAALVQQAGHAQAGEGSP